MASSKSRRDTRTAPIKTSSFRKYLDALLSNPSRVFLGDIIYANIGKYITDSKPLTNDNFTPDAIGLLRTIAENKGLAPGESIRVTDEDYNQYGSEFDYNIRRGQTSPDLFTKLGNLSPADELKYVIGQAVIKMDDDGNITLKDQYDFNFYADFEKGEVLTPEEFEAAGISLKDALVSSWENRPDNMSFAENVGFLLGSRDYEGTEKDTARKVEIDLGNISEPFKAEKPKEPTKTVGSKGRKKSPVVAEVLQEQFSPTRPKARPEGLAAKPKQKNEKIESLSKEIVEYFETLPERELAPEISLRPTARPEEDPEIAKLAEDIEEYLDNPLAPVSSPRPVARPERTTSSENKQMSKLFGEVEQYLDNPLAPTRSLRPVAKPEGLPSTQEDTAVESSLRPKMRPEFAEGGAVMDDQMNKLLMARGGLKDDGMNMDPVSGNEVPPGSLAQEVRDDIPAQLSDGEYVVPADVVRYYGVKFFEDLRQEAKSGLSGMEKDGRIGGEPAPDMPAGLGGEMPEGDNMPEGDITPEMFEALMAQAGRGQAPLRMATGGVATVSNNPFNLLGSQTDLLGNTITTGSYTTGQTAEEPTGDTAKIESQRTFPNQTGMPGYSAQTMGIVGSPTIAQIGTGIPAYVYRYIDPLTGKLIDVKPGETPPPGAIPVETAPVEEEEEDYDDGNLWENRPEEKPYDPTNVRGMNYNDPVAGAQASYDSAFGSGGVLGAASKAPGILGFAAGGIQELNRINAISQINGQLSLTEARFGKDSAEAAKVRSLLDDALEKAKLDNILPQGWYNGTGRVTGAYKDYKKNGGTLSYADWLSGGAAAPTSKPTTTKPTTTKPVATKPVARPDRGESDAGLSVARSMSKEDREKGQEYAATGTARSETWSGGQVAKTQSYTAPTTQEEARQRTEAAVASGQTRATGGRARGGLMRRSNPVKRK